MAKKQNTELRQQLRDLYNGYVKIKKRCKPNDLGFHTVFLFDSKPTHGWL